MRVDGYALIGVYELKVKSGLKGKEVILFNNYYNGRIVPYYLKVSISAVILSTDFLDNLMLFF